MLRKLKGIVKQLPIVGPLAGAAYKGLTGKKPLNFENSKQYWEDRYKAGRNSGSGSYGRLAQFKAEFLNQFVAEKGINSIVEFGCGDGAQLERAEYPNYIGFDVAQTAVSICSDKFSNNPNYSFDLVGSKAFNSLEPVELALSLDVIYHLIEDDIFHSYMTKLFTSSTAYVVIFAYDFDKQHATQHERGRNFTAWTTEFASDWKLVHQEKNPFPYESNDPDNTSQSHFYVYSKAG